MPNVSSIITAHNKRLLKEMKHIHQPPLPATAESQYHAH